MTAAAPRPLTTHAGATPATSPLARAVAVVTGLFGLTLFVAGLVTGIRAGFDTTDSGYVVPLLLGVPYLAIAAVAWRHGSDHPGRWAWTAGAFGILGVLTYLAVYVMLSEAVGADWTNPDTYTTSQAVVANTAAILVVAAAPIVAAFETVQAVRHRRGDRATT